MSSETSTGSGNGSAKRKRYNGADEDIGREAEHRQRLNTTTRKWGRGQNRRHSHLFAVDAIPVHSLLDDEEFMSSQTSPGSGNGSAKRKRYNGTDEYIGRAAEHRQRLLETKSRQLEEREAAFEKHAQLFEQANPPAGKESDVLKLNIGGTTKIAVSRRVLTHFEHSVLASKFSGRWDDSLEKDDEGNFFIDFGAAEFSKLISCLRLYAYNVSDDDEIPSPLPTYKFCSMLAHYGLMSAIYPPRWQCCWGHSLSSVVSFEEESFVSDHSGAYKNSGVAFKSNESYPGLFVSSFRVLVQRGYAAQVGWSTFAGFLGECQKFGHNKKFGNFAIDLSSQEFVSKSNAIRRQERSSLQSVNIRERDVAIECSYDGEGNYAITIAGPDGEISESVESRFRMYPAISFTGRVTVSSVRYRYPRSPV